MNPLDYFEDFLSIPRASGHEEKISEYLCNFAKQNNLYYYVDDVYNVIIKRKSNTGSKETIILQDHTDMVCTSDHDYNFKDLGIDWYIEDGFYKAHGTTLGADNGIGCSIILALLANNDIKVPNIEAIFTVQEETTMEGAKRLDYSKISGQSLISIDGTSEGVIEVSSAGMASINVHKKLIYVDNALPTYKITIDGLPGGHSGVDIDKNIGNAIKIMGDILYNIKDVRLASIIGGSKENVIPSECMCIIATNEQISVDNAIYEHFPDAHIVITEVEKCAKVINEADSKDIIRVMHTIPNGVLTYRGSFPQTSLNLGVIGIENEVINIDLSIRSSNVEDEEKYINLVKTLCQPLTFNLIDRKPFFSFKEKSPLREALMKKYKELYHQDIMLEDVHAGLEGGIFAEHIKDLDICVISPNLYDIHTIKERVEIASVMRVYNWLISFLEDTATK